ncbi:MAG: AbrB/MazE/SpoVT family DNA-binding domain-containing protein [Clostridia bacterium]|jgi:hypothetical protein|nr:AbrB/MazE/SpoVT family DNA-binding domain-containing protein [Clostridia bacterium]
MEKRNLKITFNKSGSGSITKRITLPSKFISDMGITEQDRDVELLYDEQHKQIILRKAKKN